ncbi:hypothetical protein QJ048_16020 [Pinibacter sp. MAH-24]|uniref:DUF4294 domain-containing protein n=2 Tax=Pinibacter soli TaxID=3044211 RepID=A0ABT6RFG0_9BACT|nr:hypothetical protein [Pinibacter soli]
MKHAFLHGLLLMLPFITRAQSFQFQRISIGAIDSIEKKQNSRLFKYGYPIGVSEDYFPGRTKYKLAQPIVYRKEVKGFSYETSYYYSLPDSTLRLIEYWWEGDTNSEADFNELLEKNRKELAAYIKGKETYQPETDTKGASDIFENDLIFGEQFSAKGMQRIRVKISWK